jgi:hypothetical protein
MLKQIQIYACTRLLVHGDFGRKLMRLTDQFKAGAGQNYDPSLMIIEKTLMLCMVIKDLGTGGRCLFEECLLWRNWLKP